MNSIWRSAAFWIMLVSSVAQVLVGLNYKLESEMLVTITSTVIAYLLARGYVSRGAAPLGVSKNEGSNNF